MKTKEIINVISLKKKKITTLLQHKHPKYDGDEWMHLRILKYSLLASFVTLNYLYIITSKHFNPLPTTVFILSEYNHFFPSASMSMPKDTNQGQDGLNLGHRICLYCILNLLALGHQISILNPVTYTNISCTKHHNR